MKNILCLIAVLLLSNCGRPGRVEQPPEQRFDRVWVNPQVIAGDSLFTLISAPSVDSIVHDPTMVSPVDGRGLDFEVREPNCLVEVTLLNHLDETVRGLHVQLLPKGYYRVTVTPLLIEISRVDAAATLRAVACGREYRQTLLLND